MQNALKGITLGGDTRSLDALKLQARANKLNMTALMRAKAEKVAAGATNESSGAGKRATNVILERDGCVH